MTTDKTSLGVWAREKAFIVCPTWSENEKLENETREKIEAAIIEGMVAALDEAKVVAQPFGGTGVGESIDALKKELRGNLP